MQEILLQEAKKYAKQNCRSRIWRNIVRVMACIVVFCTTYALILPAITMERTQCGLSEHTHSESCYEKVDIESAVSLACTYESLGVHVHTSSCYDGENNLLCGQADYLVHEHNEDCLDENGVIVCQLPKVRAHEHTEDCYSLPETEPAVTQEVHFHGDECYANQRGELTCEFGEDDAHEHTDACYETVSTLVCELEEGIPEETAEPVQEAEPELICEKPVVKLHTHNDATCYETYVDADGNEQRRLICPELEVFEHVHSNSCFVAEESVPETRLICGLEEHTHTQSCYEETDYQCGLERHTHNDDCYDADDNLICWIPEHVHTDECLSEETEPPQVMNENNSGGELKLKLFYDGADEDNLNNPEGIAYYTEDTMTGYLKIYPVNLPEGETSQNVTVTLRIPRAYVEKDSVEIPEFSSQSAHIIDAVTEDGEYYLISVHFDEYAQTETVTFPFALSFVDGKTPDNYQLPVCATVVYDGFAGSQTPEIIFKPKYDPWEIVKYVNSNQNPAFAEDGASALVTAEELNGDPHLGDDTYVAFQFLVNGLYADNGVYSTVEKRRDVCEITITDTMPTYLHMDGTTHTAVFDTAKNPGWVLSEDGAAASKTYMGASAQACADAILTDTLFLRFPGAKLETKTAENDGTVLTYLAAELSNAVSMLATPSNMAEGETKPVADDTLRFCLSSSVPAEGQFIKTAAVQEIYDVYSGKANELKWELVLANPTTQDFYNVVIHDNSVTAEMPDDTSASLDERLKFVRLESGACVFQDNRTNLYDIVDRIDLVTDSGEKVTYTVDQLSWMGTDYFDLILDESKVFTSFEICFKDSYQMKMNEQLTFCVYTVFKNPEASHYSETDNSKNFFANSATATYTYPHPQGTDMMMWLTSQSHFHINPSTEDVRVQKRCYSEGPFQSGSQIIYAVNPIGVLDENKDYADICMIDLLPPGMSYIEDSWYYHPDYNSPDDASNEQYPFVDFLTCVEVRENYHNSGRTALIFHMDGNLLRQKMQQAPEQASVVQIYYKLLVEQDIVPGQHMNHVYLTGDNLDLYKGDTAYEIDVYDLNNNARTDDKIAHDQVAVSVVAAEAVYAEALIKLADASEWTKQTLNLLVGSEFDYLLKISNETLIEKAGLVIFDTLPRIGDQNISLTDARNSEFTVQLRDAITPPEGYQVYYTTDPGVYAMTMDEAVKNDSLWTQTVTDYTLVTAFKVAADEGTVIAASAAAEIQIPAKVVDALDDASLALLQEKEPEDHETGTVTALVAANAFGYRTGDDPEVKESNPVSVKIGFAGFRIKMIDSESGNGLAGVVFELKDSAGTESRTLTSDEEGFVQFDNLPVGVYTLSQTKAPAGYYAPKTIIRVTVTLDEVTMGYTVAFSGEYEGVGSVSDPLIIENRRGVVLPKTGGTGTTPYTVAGLVLIFISMAYLMYRPKSRGRGSF